MGKIYSIYGNIGLFLGIIGAILAVVGIICYATIVAPEQQITTNIDVVQPPPW